MSRTIEDYVLAVAASGASAFHPGDVYDHGRAIAAEVCAHLGHIPDPKYGKDPLGAGIDDKARCRRCRAVLAEG